MVIMLFAMMVGYIRNCQRGCHQFVGRLVLFGSCHFRKVKTVCLALCWKVSAVSLGCMLGLSMCRDMTVGRSEYSIGGIL